MTAVRSLQARSTARLFAVSITLLHAAAVPPHLELAKWNKAYKLSISNIDTQVNLKYNIINPTCSEEGYNSSAAAVPLDSCFFRQDADRMYSTWTKMAGEWRVNSNCYCYALNVYKGGFCIPGFHDEYVMNALKAGEPKNCNLMTRGLIADGAQHVTRDQALSAEQPINGHYVGLLVRRRGCTPAHCWNDDFHLVRRDRNGLWSWKEPGGPVQAVDIHGQPVSDPEASTIPGHYDTWCGYFLVDPANMKIGGNFRHDYSLLKQLEFLRKLPGVKASLHATPYNHTVDGASDKFTAQWLVQNAEWHTKQGSKEWDEFYAQQNTSQSDGFAEHFAKQRLPADTVLQKDPPTPAAAQSARSGPGNVVEYLQNNYQADDSETARINNADQTGGKGSASGQNVDGSHHAGSVPPRNAIAAATASTGTSGSSVTSSNNHSTTGSKALPRPAAATNAGMPEQTHSQPPQSHNKQANIGNRHAQAGRQHVANKTSLASPAAAAAVQTKGKSSVLPDGPANLMLRPSHDALSGSAQRPTSNSATATATAGSLSVSLPPWSLVLRLAHTEPSIAKLAASTADRRGSAIDQVAGAHGGHSGRRMLKHVSKQHGLA